MDAYEWSSIVGLGENVMPLLDNFCDLFHWLFWFKDLTLDLKSYFPWKNVQHQRRSSISWSVFLSMILAINMIWLSWSALLFIISWLRIQNQYALATTIFENSTKRNDKTCHEGESCYRAIREGRGRGQSQSQSHKQRAQDLKVGIGASRAEAYFTRLNEWRDIWHQRITDSLCYCLYCNYSTHLEWHKPLPISDIFCLFLLPFESHKWCCWRPPIYS